MRSILSKLSDISKGLKFSWGTVSSVAKCRGSWVVGTGPGSWVWVNVVGKSKIIVAKFKPHRVYSARI